MSKYHSHKVTVDGQTFDSMKEYKRYCELKLMLRAGLISKLERQKRFELLPSQRINGKCVERPVYYVADFVYTEDGQTVVEDVKGFKTHEYRLKKKMMLFFHHIQIRET